MRISYSNSVLVSVRLSDCDKIMSSYVRGSLRTRVSIRATATLKSGYFTAIRSFSVKTVADKHRHAAYRNKLSAVSTSMTINDFESLKYVFGDFAICGCCAHFKSELRRNGQR